MSRPAKKGSHWCISQKKKKKDINIPTNCRGLSMAKKPVMLAVCGWAKIWWEACWLEQQSKQKAGRQRWMWYVWLRESENPKRAGISRQPSLLHLPANLTFCKTNRGWKRSLHVRLSCLISKWSGHVFSFSCLKLINNPPSPQLALQLGITSQISWPWWVEGLSSCAQRLPALICW